MGTTIRPGRLRRPDDATGVPARLLRTAMGQLPTGVAVVAALDDEGRPAGATVSSLTSVSLEPPLILVCLSRSSRTLGVMAQAGRFGVSVLAAAQRPLSDRFAGRGGDDPWEGVAHRVDHGAPLLTGAVAELVCDVEDTMDGGDHAIVLGRVVAADHADDHAEPLAHHRGGYGIRAEAAAPPVAEPEVPLPSVFGDLLIRPLGRDDARQVSAAVIAGRPHGRDDALLYVHRGCLLGDALGALCPRRAALDHALAAMGEDAPGVVVYHRRQDGGAGCCAGGDDGDAPLGADEVTAVRRAVRALDLRGVRLIGDASVAWALAEAGVRVTGLVPPHHRRSADVHRRR